jgi:deoxyribodipyrimidine photolyase-related protein
MPHHPAKKPRHLILTLGDQLDPASTVFNGFNPEKDAIWMAEVPTESTHVWSHKARITLFLSAMRHYAQARKKEGKTVHYKRLDHRGNQRTFDTALRSAVAKLKPAKLLMTEPGEWRVKEELLSAAKKTGTALEVFSDRHFISSKRAFQEHAQARKQLRMEFFYRQMRKKTGVLMDGSKPVGGKWNLDTENRRAFGKKGPEPIPPPRSFPPDAITAQVIDMVNKRFRDHPGYLNDFDWPVTPAQGQKALKDFIEKRLPLFGTYQDAMWADQPYLYHSRLSAALNLKLLSPLAVILDAERSFQGKKAPLNATEGFIRQILGWREYVRGIYWQFMPDYLQMNALKAMLPLPDFYWTADTEMYCLHQVIKQTLRYGYAHHIQRLMVTGLFALLLGVRPQEVHKWYLAVYVDAVEWVELPNTLGMSQYADGGIMASKPYVATGKYIQRMSNYCSNCPYKPAETLGRNACPFTTLYWDFLARHQDFLKKNARMGLQLQNLKRLSKEKKKALRIHAEKLKKYFTKSLP